MINVSIELISPYRSLLGIFFQKGSELVEGEKMYFTEISFGVIFIFLRFVKYNKEGLWVPPYFM